MKEKEKKTMNDSKKVNEKRKKWTIVKKNKKWIIVKN